MSAASSAPAARAQPRFPADVAAALKQAGWHPGRWQIRQAEEWADELVAHGDALSVQHTVFPAAVEAWAEFGGLSFGLTGAGRRIARTPFLLDPRCGLHQPRTLADLGRALGTRIAPLGEELYGQALLAVDEEGRVYSLDHTGEWFLGHTIDQAVATLVLGLTPDRLQTAP
ncbi:SUKH-3 domain-containing protein [Kitasatospora kazusensis]|uniref:SUKH-3 domain-containing protein n=1 Tax=Kitasatospora kazusensis TaxID=407974 RepID=A0ABP5LM37_9ACTN